MPFITVKEGTGSRAEGARDGAFLVSYTLIWPYELSFLDISPLALQSIAYESEPDLVSLHPVLPRYHQVMRDQVRVEYQAIVIGTFGSGSLVGKKAFLSGTVVAVKDSDGTDGAGPHHLPEGDGQSTIADGEVSFQYGVRAEPELQ